MLILLVAQFIYPGIYLRSYFETKGLNKKNVAVDYYVFLKLALGLAILFTDWYRIGLWVIPPSFFMLLCIYLTSESIIYPLTFIICKSFFQPPTSYARPIILGLVNYLEVITTYAVVYSITNSISGSNQSSALTHLDYLYFSSISSFTVGFGDIVPNSQLGKILVMSQSFIFFHL